jgi:hypothetical protein
MASSRWRRVAIWLSSSSARSDAGEQVLVGEGLFDEIAGAALQRAETAIGTSPWPVTKMIGSCEPSALSFSCSSRPLISGIRTSSTRQPRMSSRRALRKLSAESKQATR